MLVSHLSLEMRQLGLNVTAKEERDMPMISLQTELSFLAWFWVFFERGYCVVGTSSRGVMVNTLESESSEPSSHLVEPVPR